MSSNGQIIGGIVGAVIGFYVGGPLGALQGAALGAGVGIALDPPKGPTVEGPRLQDKGVQISTYGAFMPRVYGTIAGGGNITQIENNELKETVRKESSGGKGGGSETTMRTYSYSATFQLSLCEGPITGVRRIWCGDKLIYNAGSDDLETIIASNRAAEGFRVYLGTDDQLPDPRYEAEYGVGNVSAHRGEAYISFYDFQLADYSNTLQAAQFKVEVVKSADFDGLREIVDVQSGIVYRHGSPLEPGVGRPYILSAFSTSFVTAGGNKYIHNSSGMGSYNGPADFDDVLPDKDGDVHFCGHLDNDKVLQVKYTNDTYIDGEDVGLYEQTTALPISTVVLLADTGIDVTDKKLIGATVSGNGAYLIIAFCDDTESTSGAISYVHLFTSDFVHVETFVTDEEISRIAPISFGRSAQNNFGASCLSDDGSTLYFAYGAGLGQLEAWSLSNGVMTQTHFISGAFTSGGTFGIPSIMAIDGVIYVVSGTGFYIYVASDKLNNNTVFLEDIVATEVSQSSLIGPADIDVSDLTSEVRGYRVSGGALRAALEPLQAAFPFDVRAHGYQIQFLPRGQASIVAIPWEDLGASDNETPGQLLQQSREMDSQLPVRTTIKYLDAAREYGISEQYSERLNTAAVNRVDRELPLVLNATEAAGVAEVLNFLPWLERTDAAFVLPPPYRYLEPGDVVTVDAPNATYEFRLTEVNEMADGRIECRAKQNRAALYDSNATGAEGVAPDGSIGVGGVSLFLPLDIPVVDETVQNAVGFVGVMTGYTDAWPGGLVVRSNDGGQTWLDLQAFAGKASIGIAVDSLPENDCTLIDQREITVSMISGTPESITQDQMLAGANYVAYGRDGRWEIIRFQNATLQGDGTYLISVFVRGDRGTEWATGLHEDGDYFVLLDDSDNAFIGSSVETIALERIYRGVTAGLSVDTADNVLFTYQGVNLECLSPVYAAGTRSAGDLTATWTRRSRLSSSWWATGVVAPVGEESQAYEVDVMDGADVVRTITASTPTITYTSAQQTTDFGSPQSSIDLRIYQMSAVVGRGYPLEVTL